MLSAILRASSAHSYNAGDPAQRRRATFATLSTPYNPSLMTDVVFMPQYSVLDANVSITGWLAAQGWATQGVIPVTGNYTTTYSDAVVLADATSGPVTITLGDATGTNWVSPGQRQTIIKTDSGSNSVTVTGSAGQKIAGGTSVTLTASNGYTGVVFDGSNWQVCEGLTLAGSTPSGTAGGDLGGTYPNPTVAATHLSAALPVAQGGTGASTGSAALTSLGAAPLAGAAFTGAVTAPDMSATGLTGATAASRYVGATASGSPASGTFAAGDYVIAQNGAVWVCTTAGSPGTWVSAGGTPSGAAGGDLSGTYPNPAVAKVNGVAITGTPSSGSQIRATSSSAGQWQALAQADTNTWTVTQTVQTQLTTSYSIGASDPAAGTVYELLAWGSGTWGSTQQQLTINANLAGTGVGGNMAISSTSFAASAVFNWEYLVRIFIATTGATGTANIMHKWTASNGLVSGQTSWSILRSATAVAINTTTANAVEGTCAWASTTGAPTITCNGTMFQRLGA